MSQTTTVFFRALEADDKASALLEAITHPGDRGAAQRFDVDARTFNSVPRSPFVYWVSESLRGLFKSLPPFEKAGRAAKVGLQTADDFRFVRAWWEVKADQHGHHWFPFAKGGKFSPIYVDPHLCVNWENDGREMKAWTVVVYGGGHWSRNIRNPDFYLRTGITWPRRPSRQGAFSHLPPGCIFSDGGPVLFCDQSEHWWLCALLNSAPYRRLLHFLMPRGTTENSGQTLKYETGYVTSVPVPYDSSDNLSEMARRYWSLKRSLDTRNETSHAFILPALLQVGGETLHDRIAAYRQHANDTNAEIVSIQSQIDAHCLALYGINPADLGGIDAGEQDTNDSHSAKSDELDASDVDESPEAEDDLSFGAELVSWAIGVAFGKFDVRFSTGERTAPGEPDPFAPLPAISPGMLSEDGQTLSAGPPKGYPIQFSGNGVLVGDLGHPDDLAAAVRSVLEAAFRAQGEEWWSDLGALLDLDSKDLRGWIEASFFEYHLRRYSMGRRKAPVIWQLSVPSGQYSIWLDAHRLNRDSFVQMQNDLIAPKLEHEERTLANMILEAGSAPSTRQRDEIGDQRHLLEELRQLLDEVKRLAPLWRLFLDDGIVLAMAPLWRLFPRQRSWQSELRVKWDELAAGKYDWAKISMHLWPERVVPKCATDRSIAIAHDLENVFWLETEDGEWKPREKPEVSVSKLIQDRTSLLVKAALKGLLEAPGGPTRSKRTRKSKLA
ncbi:hypothetical protein [Bradyrhizobium japonicum]|uniref:hypothetical protein n=1 Tax=Bradyrhizobium japonicum TaxID=375 RepID=UPI0004AFF9D0|nr:hypothetical protein [Bradyrhizobium japonicum]